LFKCLFGIHAKRNRALWRLANARKDIATILILLAHVIHTGAHGVRIENVDVERRHGARQRASVLRIGPRLRIHVDHLGRDFVQRLPLPQALALVVLAVLRWCLAVERDRAIAGFAESMPIGLRVRHGSLPSMSLRRAATMSSRSAVS